MMLDGMPDPGQARTVEDVIARLRLLKMWAGSPSYEVITSRVNEIWSAAGRPAAELARRGTVADCFKPGRRRLNTDLVVTLVQALHPDEGYVAQWRQTLRVVAGETHAAAQVRAQDSLPGGLADFTGRGAELDQVRALLLSGAADGATVVICTEGMAGVGKTELAIHAGHLLAAERPFAPVLFVNLRGFGPDPSQPPADPAAVLDNFLRLLGVSGQQIPHDLHARTDLYRQRLAGTRALVVLDNAADEDQVRPLLPGGTECLTLITTRRRLTGLHLATHLSVDVFTPDEAVTFLSQATSTVPVGADPHAAARIAQRCGHLPLALGLVAGHIQGAAAGWTLTDHAERLDERHRHHRVETGVELAFDLSYHHLPEDRRRLLRLVALHPGQDFDAHAASALAGGDLSTVRDHLRQLCRDHLLQQAAPGRYSFHDLVRAYAVSRATDEDPRSQRRSAVGRLLDLYLHTAAAAMDVVYPYERHRPKAPANVGAIPDVADEDKADRWLELELANLLACARHAAQHGWADHAWQLASTLDRHLRTRGRHQDAQTLHEQALHLAVRHGNRPAEMNALNGLGYVDRIVGRQQRAAEHYERALQLARSIGERHGELQAHHGLGDVCWNFGDYAAAGEHYAQALRLAQEIDDRSGQLHALNGIGYVHRMHGRFAEAGEDYARALGIAEDIRDRHGELHALTGLGFVERTLGRHATADGHYRRALRIARGIGDRGGELYALAGLAYLHRTLGRHSQAGEHYERALRIAHSIGDRSGELNALAGLGFVHRAMGHHDQAAAYQQQVLDLARRHGNTNWQYEALQALGRLRLAAGRPDLALSHHQEALRLATAQAQPADQARAHDGLAHAHHSQGRFDPARTHWQHALDILTGLGVDHTEDVETSVPNILAHLAALDH